ncbi:pyrimidine dimer DNA glycosylase/endonuclease V [Arcanobacterium bovis]|uniref:Pyrimidine dimer DNA glycosylase n=1 Tax=Arcanobacterium bovis TaxID=2529275 RepID=A0A4Q9V3Q5_9ACTO|nr:pyrimidine dimer DNA glycosylase/endonuclease V [Arcanobacterium bovis]TBW23753.1 hypothetical protein EZJ44_01045 [Arcanobacterium bovis]
MRLWSLHPSLLDRQGLTALWREALLAQAVLAGRTRGYTKHPQLNRFQNCPDPRGAIAHYLEAVYHDAVRRGYNYDPTRIDDVPRYTTALPVTRGQVLYEREHLFAKLQRRSPELATDFPSGMPALHPSFYLVEGDIEPWEVVQR